MYDTALDVFAIKLIIHHDSHSIAISNLSQPLTYVQSITSSFFPLQHVRHCHLEFVFHLLAQSAHGYVDQRHKIFSLLNLGTFTAPLLTMSLQIQSLFHQQSQTSNVFWVLAISGYILCDSAHAIIANSGYGPSACISNVCFLLSNCMALTHLWILCSMDFHLLSLAHVNCLATLYCPHCASDNKCVWFFNILIPCYYNPKISPIVCSMQYAPQRNKTTWPGIYHIIAMVGLLLPLLSFPFTNKFVFSWHHFELAYMYAVLCMLNTNSSSWEILFMFLLLLHFSRH